MPLDSWPIFQVHKHPPARITSDSSSDGPQLLGQKKGPPLNGRETIRIDGAWRRKVDPADAGVKGEWFARVPTDVREVNVPGAWPKTDEESNRTVWYWKQIESPKSRPGWN